MSAATHLEDFRPGQRFRSAPRPLDPALLARFPNEFASHGDVAPPLLVASATMRLIVDSDFRPAGGILGAGIEALEWPHPAPFGASLHVQSEVLEVRRSQSRPDRGTVRVRNVTVDGDGRVVQSMVSTVIVPARA